MSDSKKVDRVMREIHALLGGQRELLEKMNSVQAEVLIRARRQQRVVSNEECGALIERQRQLKSTLELERERLANFYDRMLLTPQQLNLCKILRGAASVQYAQLMIYVYELARARGQRLPGDSGDAQQLLKLVITEQPFPLVVTKGKALDASQAIAVKLLRGAGMAIRSISHMKVVTEWAAGTDRARMPKNAAKSMVANDTMPVDGYKFQSVWVPRFVCGTRKSPVRLRFGVHVMLDSTTTGGDNPIFVRSQLTESLIVITNEAQWSEAEGLLLGDALGGNGGVDSDFGDDDDDDDDDAAPWHRFANALQRSFVSATRQNAVTPRRPLSPTDFAYLHRKSFGGAAVVDAAEVARFWDWYGKGLQKLRSQRHVSSLWQFGVLHGYTGREQVNNFLSARPVGTFFLRFSERHPGSFAVAYRVESSQPSEPPVRHYLVREDDTAGNKKTLPDFIAEHASFAYIMQIVRDPYGAITMCRAQPKDNILRKFYSKRPQQEQATDGYDTQVVQTQVNRSFFGVE
jgi:EF-hand fold domain/STATa Immunoglobulin-like domain/Dictyostelium STAT, coiled coil/SH2 domain